ncbi:MAG TPA: hypothetical protein VHX88_09505, partial [Solirubrobacteraceae bacterium]|nr:hypothetical protein [Solirubrobacteraceae bacterium]
MRSSLACVALSLAALAGLGPAATGVSARDGPGAHAAVAPAHIEIELKSWIPQPRVVDPEIPLANTPALATPPATALTGRRAICRVPAHLSEPAYLAYLARTRISSNFNGNDHDGFAGPFKVDMPLRFDFVGEGSITDFRVAAGRHVATTHRLIGQRSGEHRYHCQQLATAPDTVGRTGTGAHGIFFTGRYAVSQPETPAAKLAPIQASVNGVMNADGKITLTVTHTEFPSSGVQISINGRVLYTDIFNDASCLSDQAVLGPGGAALLLRGLTTTATTTVQMPAFNITQPAPTPSPLC